jgi:hypothetical protein
MTPGSNTLALALSVLGSTSVNYFQYAGRTTNAGGVMLATYNAPIVITQGSVQAVKREKYDQLGLDFAKRYINWYVPNLDVVDLERDVSGDVIEVLGRRWQLIGSNDWLGVDGWKSIMAIDIGAATGATTNG